MNRILYRRRSTDGWPYPSPPDLRGFHQAIGPAGPTRLLAQPVLAHEYGVASVEVKLETDRYGLPSFKVMGASWATVEALRPVLPSWWAPDQGLRPLAGKLPPLTLVAATDGNHGRALARVAAWLGLRATIYVPEDMLETRVAAIEAEGAEVVRVAGSYDDAVDRSAVDAKSDDRVLVSDTSWPGYERVPAAVIDGYATILWEVEEQLRSAGRRTPDLVLVPIGVGAFAAAVVRHFRRPGGPEPRIVGVEPSQAACVMASLAADRLVTVPGPHHSVMAGLNCGTPSLIAWPVLRAGLDAVLSVDDDQAIAGTAALAAGGIAVGECSGAVVAGARELLAGPDAELHRARLGIDADSSVLLFATEGVTDGSRSPVPGTGSGRPDATQPSGPGAMPGPRPAPRLTQRRPTEGAPDAPSPKMEGIDHD